MYRRAASCPPNQKDTPVRQLRRSPDLTPLGEAVPSNGITWDCLICCEMLDVYKTQPEAYQRAAKLLQLRPDELLMVACHNFDLLAARREGYRTAFVRRPQEWGDAGPPDPIPDPSIDLVVDDFPALAAALGT